jgi:biopolymer transport protein ExbB/TolQ
MEIFGIGITLLSLVLAWQAWRNGRLIKEVIKGIKEIMTEMDNREGERHKEIMAVTEERHKEVMKAIEEREKAAEERHKEVMKAAEERHKEVMKAAEERHKEALRVLDKISELIASVQLRRA